MPVGQSPAALFDTHAHLAAPELVSRHPEVVRAAVDAGVTRVLTVACQPDGFAPALALRDAYPEIWLATGIHPHGAAEVTEADWSALARTWREPRVAAAGELGLDYHYDFSPREVQRDVLKRQLELAAATGKPLVVHCREAQDDMVRLLLAHGFEGRAVVFHCFSGTPEEAAELRAHGWWTSFTGLITFRNAGPQREACVQTPADQLMFETDAPYLSPEPVRRMRPNQPCNLVHTVRFAADLRGEPFEQLVRQSTANAQRFFGIC